jgi:hypothetical protein
MKLECRQLKEQVEMLMRNEMRLAKFVNTLNSTFIGNVKSLVDECCRNSLQELTENLSQQTEYMEILMRDVRCQVLDQFIDSLSNFLTDVMPISKVKTRYVHNLSVLGVGQVETICSGYEKEILGLQRFVDEIMRKWLEAQSHMSELDRQVEEQVKLLYRYHFRSFYVTTKLLHTS